MQMSVDDTKMEIFKKTRIPVVQQLPMHSHQVVRDLADIAQACNSEEEINMQTLQRDPKFAK